MEFDLPASVKLGRDAHLAGERYVGASPDVGGTAAHLDRSQFCQPNDLCFLAGLSLSFIAFGIIHLGLDKATLTRPLME
jgi:hypothetical protein